MTTERPVLHVYHTRIAPASFRGTSETPATRAYAGSGPHLGETTGQHVAGIVLAVLMGCAAAMLLVHWWSS